VKGFDSTIGYTQWANKPAEQDAAVRYPNLPFSPSPSPSTHSHLLRARPSRLSRHSAQLAPSSSPRPMSHRRFSLLRAATLSGDVRAIHGRPHTLRVAPQVVRVHCSRWTAPRSALVRMLEEVYVFQPGIVGSLVLNRDRLAWHMQALLVSVLL